MVLGLAMKRAGNDDDKPRLVSVNTVDNLCNNIRSSAARVEAARVEMNAALDAHFEARSALAYHLNNAGLDVDVRLLVPDIERDFARLREPATDE